jgi:membrane associated rhomboid family serine protease
MGIENRDYYRDSPVYSDGGGGGGWSAGSVAPVCKYLLIITIAVFVLQLFTAPQVGAVGERYDLVQKWLQLDGTKVIGQGQVWRLVTCAFCHSRKKIFHIVFNMLFLFWFGRTLERMYGSREFLLFYITAALMASLAYIGLDLITGENVPMIGASGAVMGVMMLYAIHFPRQQILLFFVIPLEIRWLVLFYVIFDLYPVLLELSGSGAALEPSGKEQSGGVAHAAHLGGLAFGFVYWRWHLRLEKFWLSLRALRFDRLFGSRRGIRLHQPSREGKQKSMDAKVDRILEKIHAEGEASLTARERQVLMKASQQYKDQQRKATEGDE